MRIRRWKHRCRTDKVELQSGSQTRQKRLRRQASIPSLFTRRVVIALGEPSRAAECARLIVDGGVFSGRVADGTLARGEVVGGRSANAEI